MTDRGDPFTTIVLSIPGVGKWVWTEALQTVSFHPHGHRRPAEEITLVTNANNALDAMRAAARRTAERSFAEAHDPGKRLKRFKDG